MARCSTASCPRLAVPGLAKCEQCLKSARNYARRIRKTQAEMGLCAAKGCESLPVPGRAQCQYHLDTAKERAKRLRDKRKDQGLCYVCAKYPAIGPQNGLCITCHDRRLTYYRKRADAKKHLYQRRMAAGLCTLCGKQSPIPGTYNNKPRATCEECNTKRRQKNAKKRVGNERSKILERDGFICQLCGRQKRLHVHHIDGVGTTSDCPNNDWDNLITLCHYCHYAITCLRQAPLENRPLAVQLLLA